jgi:hypothetical protein
MLQLVEKRYETPEVRSPAERDDLAVTEARKPAFRQLSDVMGGHVTARRRGQRLSQPSTLARYCRRQ